MISTSRAFSLMNRAFVNYFFHRPFCVSFEITRSCNARCQHCHLGGQVEEERASPQKYGQLCRQLKPLTAQISGGEPLLRRDLVEIIREIRIPNRAPFLVLTTNATLLSKEKYSCLREAGVDEFSISLDYPDERHDEFRGVPGLFRRIQTLIEEVGKNEDNGITLSCVIQRDNFREALNMAELARKWKVKMNFSTYTWLRTNNKDFLIPREELPQFQKILEQLLEHKKKYKVIFTSEYVLKNMLHFFENEAIPHCKPGKRFLVVNPDGTLSPCGLIIKDYKEKRELKKEFLKNNNCSWCYTSIRANTEKPLKYLILDSLRSL